jgi:hypothetical protein
MADIRVNFFPFLKPVAWRLICHLCLRCHVVALTM